MFSITVSGLEELRARLAAAQSAIGPMLLAAAEAATESIVEELSGAAPVGNGPVNVPPPGDEMGPLFESFKSEVDDNETSFVARVLTTQPLKLQWIRFGTGIYGPLGQRIYPRQASALRWVDADGTVWIRGSVAGMEPNDFVTPIIEAATEQVAQDMQAAGAEIVSMLEG